MTPARGQRTPPPTHPPAHPTARPTAQPRRARPAGALRSFAAAAATAAALAGCGPHRPPAAAPAPPAAPVRASPSTPVATSAPAPHRTARPRPAVPRTPRQRPAARPTVTPVAAAPAAAPAGCLVTARSGETTVDGRPTVLLPVGAAGSRLPTRRGLVVALPGYGRTAQDLLAQSRFGPRAAAAGVVLAVPQGEGSQLAWDFAHVGTADDVGLLRDVVAVAVRTACVDPARVVLTGISDGGDMAAWAACSDPGRWRAVVTVAASTRPQPGCRPVRLLALHGDADPLDPYGGGADGRPGYPDIPPARSAIGSWAASNGCSTPTTSSAGTDLTVTRFPCSAELITVRGGGHTWPGGVPGDPSLGRTATDLDATGLVLSLV